MAQKSRNLLRRVVDESRDGLVTFAEWVGSDGTREAMRVDLGLPGSGAAAPSPDIAPLIKSIDDYRNKATEDYEDYQAYVDAVRDLKALFEAIRGSILAIDSGSGPEIAEEIANQCFRLMITNYLRLRIPAVYWIGQVLGLVENSFATGIFPKPVNQGFAAFFDDPIGHVKSVYVRTDEDGGQHFLDTEADAARVSHAFFIPLSVYLGFFHKYVTPAGVPAQILYGWNSPNASPTPVADRISRRALSFEFRGVQDLATQPPQPQPTTPCQPVPEVNPAESLTKKILVTMMWVPREQGGPGFFLSLGGGGQAQFRFGDDYRFTAGLTAPDAVDFFFASCDKATINGPKEAEVRLLLEKVVKPGDAPEILAFGRHVRLEFGPLRVGLELSANKGITFLASASDCALVFGTSSDPVLDRASATDYVRIDFDLGVGYAAGKWFLQGGSALEVTLPGSKTVGPVSAQAITLRLAPSSAAGQPDLKMDALVDLVFRLGPITLVINRIGMSAQAEFWSDFSLSFHKPGGIGISVKSSLINGGGFLAYNAVKEEYTGILDLTLGERISVKAVAILNQRMPDGTPGFSLAALIAVTGFSWPLVLGARITGLGGLIGVDRSLSLEALNTRLKSGALNSLMFPPDPVANAATILADIGSIFPPARDRFVFMPMLQITWGAKELVTAEIAVVIEPGSGRIVILGKVNIYCPAKKAAVVEIHLHVLGEINWAENRVFVRAELVASRIGTFALQGGAALLATWGQQKTMIFSIGGFHPRYEPQVPAAFPKLDRLTIPLFNQENARLIFRAYLAFTSNSFQAGGSIELFASFGKFSVEGMLSLDMLFQDGQPCFICDVQAKVVLKLWGETLFGVSLGGVITGTKPWRAVGKAKFEIWIFDYTVSFDISSGETEAVPELPPTDVTPQVLEALRDSRNWQAGLPSDLNGLVVLREQAAEDTILLHPLGALSIAQRIVPLDVTITRYGNARPSGHNQFGITGVVVTGSNSPLDLVLDPVLDDFARSQFFDMTEDEKLESPAFESMKCGVAVSKPNIAAGTAAAVTMQYDTLVYSGTTEKFEADAPQTLPEAALTYALRTSPAARFAADRRKYRGAAGIVKVASLSYAVATVGEQAVASTHSTWTAAVQALRTKPAKERWQVLAVTKK